MQTRAVECTGGEGKCNLKSKPYSTTRCNLGSCPEWKVGSWSEVGLIFIKRNTIISLLLLLIVTTIKIPLGSVMKLKRFKRVFVGSD